MQKQHHQTIFRRERQLANLKKSFNKKHKIIKNVLPLHRYLKNSNR